MDNKYENISTCITIVSDDLDTLKTNIINAISSNFENRLSILGIDRKCPNITFTAGTGNSIDIFYNIKNNSGDIVRSLLIANMTYDYDTTNIYLSYDRVNNTDNYNVSENINKYSVLLCFTTTDTVSGFSILNPSMLISNNDNTYSIRPNGSDSVITFKQTDAFMSYDDILEQGLNPDNIDFNNLYIRNKLIYNPNCYYELDFTDLIDNDNVKSVPYINDRFYDITEIDTSYTEYSTINTYTLCSVLSTTRINYSITEYPVLFPKTIISQDNTIKGYLNYIYDIPTQRIDTGDSINNLYSGQLINLEDSQYVLCDANTVVQIDNLIITGGDTTTTYTGRFHNFDIIYPNDNDIKVYATLTADPSTITEAAKGESITLFDTHIRTPVSESIHSWYQYNPVISEETGESVNLIEYSGVNAGNYDYLYKVCIPTGDPSLTEQKPVLKQEYLRLHKVTEVESDNILRQYPFVRYKYEDSDEYTPLSYMTSFTTVSSVMQPLLGSDVSIKIILQLYKLKKNEYGSYEKPPEFDDSVYDDVPMDPIEADVVYENEKFVIKYHNQILGDILFNNVINGVSYGAEIRLYTDIKLDLTWYDIIDFNSVKSKYDILVYHIDNDYYTVSDLVYISYYYLPDLYLEYYGYTNTYIERTNLAGYYVNTDTVVKYNVDDDPVEIYHEDGDYFEPRHKPRYGLDYYFATGELLHSSGILNGNIILINNINLYMALDYNGEPGEWTLIKPDHKYNSDLYDDFEYSIGPQHTFGYPLYPNVKEPTEYCPDSGLPQLPNLQDPDYVNKKGQILTQQQEYFSSNTYTGVIWYKIECENYNTVVGSGNVTITDIPVMELNAVYGNPDNPTEITDYTSENDLVSQGIGLDDDAIPLDPAP